MQKRDGTQGLEEQIKPFSGLVRGTQVGLCKGQVTMEEGREACSDGPIGSWIKKDRSLRPSRSGSSRNPGLKAKVSTGTQGATGSGKHKMSMESRVRGRAVNDTHIPGPLLVGWLLELRPQ